MESKVDFTGDTPHEDGHYCWRCGKHIDKLPAFGEIYPDVDFGVKEKKLFRRYREQKPPPHNPELEEILSAISESRYEDFAAIEEKYGPDMVAKAIEYEGECGLNWETWECLNCIVETGYWRKYIWRE